MNRRTHYLICALFVAALGLIACAVSNPNDYKEGIVCTMMDPVTNKQAVVYNSGWLYHVRYNDSVNTWTIYEQGNANLPKYYTPIPGSLCEEVHKK